MELSKGNVDRPKSLGDAAVKEARIRQLHEPHVAPLTAYVEELRLEAGPGVDIPDFDPWDAGVDAEILFLLEAPGARAVASTFVSRNNSDETAKNMFLLHQDACIPRGRTLLWNVVPWYIGDGARIRAATPHDLELGLRPLPRLIQMLPKLRAVVFMGKNAQRAQPQVAALRPNLRLFACAHPSPKVINTRPRNREAILKVLREAAAFLDRGTRGVEGTPADTSGESQVAHAVSVEQLGDVLSHPKEMQRIEALETAVPREAPNSLEYHWARDSYWTEALDRYVKLRERGARELTIDLDKLEGIIFDGDSPAYRAMEAMVSVREREGYEGFRGAPRIVCALLELLAYPRGGQPERSD